MAAMVRGTTARAVAVESTRDVLAIAEVVDQADSAAVRGSEVVNNDEPRRFGRVSTIARTVSLSRRARTTAWWTCGSMRPGTNVSR